MDLGYLDDVSDTMPKKWPMKKIIDKLEFIEIQSFCPMKHNVKLIRRHWLGENSCKRHNNK